MSSDPTEAARARRRGRSGEQSRSRPAQGAAGDGALKQALPVALFSVLGLLLLTPFVVTPGTIFPFVVGKALWSRSLIEIAFALWTVLALTHPGYRPPRS